MTKMNECALVRDLLPLYIDQVVSEETQVFIVEHLEKCPECKKMLEEMREELVIPLDVEQQKEEGILFENLKNAINKKVWKAVIISAFSVLFLMSSIIFLNRIQFEVEPSEVIFSENNGRVVMSYPGGLTWSAHGIPNDHGQTVWTIEFYQTFWDRYISPIYDSADHSYYLGEDNRCEIYDDDGNLLWRGSGMDSMN